jgi:hypothetical protein
LPLVVALTLLRLGDGVINQPLLLLLLLLVTIPTS